MVSTSALTLTLTLTIGLFLCSYVESLPAVVSSLEKDLEYDENQKLAKHYLVFPANRPNCGTSSWENGTGKLDFGEGITPRAIDGDALSKVFPDAEEEEDDDDVCMAACLEKGTDITLTGQAMPHFHYRSEGLRGEEEQTNLEEWVHDSCRKVEVCFINYVSHNPLLVYWIAGNGEKKPQFKLKYGEQKTYCFNSYLQHSFEVVDEENGFAETITIEHSLTKAFGTSPPSSSQKFDGIDELQEKVKSTLKHEWDRHLMVDRTFSSLGFAKGRLPDDVFANMGAFYYNNRNNIVNEEWEGKGLFVNWWETDVKFLPVPWSTKLLWQWRLSEMVSEWAGVDVEETSMYGLRQYEGGARLLSHVDRIPTHAVSLIVNVAQNNLASPWPVEVFDHGDRLHEVTMEPGDVVYYESAKNLHSRNRPLACKEGGCSYINLFTHYRPVADGDKWHRNLSDMPNRPPPLVNGKVDFDSEPSACRLPQQEEESITGNVLGVGTVECNDDRLGSYLSPTLFRLKSAKDMYRWWKATEDPNFAAFDEAEADVDMGDFSVVDDVDDDEFEGDAEDYAEEEDEDEDDEDDDDDDDNFSLGSDGKDEL
mmetsp:Transcript_10446/g.24844  ORF Transcript_10446/g.24844 Transcript_10446/m.24844 type:complete len:593 (-) Transcript_10446:150-1928(-)